MAVSGIGDADTEPSIGPPSRFSMPLSTSSVLTSRLYDAARL